MAGFVEAADNAQRRFPWLGLPIAVVYKFFDDQGNYLAAIITYYAFVAIFPLLLLSTSILGFVLQGDPELQDRVLDSALAQLPIVGDQLGRPEGLTGSTGAVVVGALVALYGSLGLGSAIQNAVNIAWSVPRNSRPNPLLLRLRSLLFLLATGLGLIAVTAVSVLGRRADVLGDGFGAVMVWLIPVATVLVVAGGLTLLLHFAPVKRPAWRYAVPGALLIAVLWQVLQLTAEAYVTRVLAGTSSMNQTFGLVLGLIGLLFLAAVMAMLGVELNVVLARRLWPRALLTPFTDDVRLTSADRKAYTSYARAQRHKGFEEVTVVFAEPPREQDPGAADGPDDGGGDAPPSRSS
jgi:YihY family inner membrane protein